MHCSQAAAGLGILIEVQPRVRLVAVQSRMKRARASDQMRWEATRTVRRHDSGGSRAEASPERHHYSGKSH